MSSEAKLRILCRLPRKTLAVVAGRGLQVLRLVPFHMDSVTMAHGLIHSVAVNNTWCCIGICARVVQAQQVRSAAAPVAQESIVIQSDAPPRQALASEIGIKAPGAMGGDALCRTKVRHTFWEKNKVHAKYGTEQTELLSGHRELRHRNVSQ